MNSNINILNLKSQLDSMKLQIENIEIQNNSQMMSQLVMNSIGEQILNLSIQMLNTGIQAFNFGKTMISNLDTFFDELNKISEQITTIINDNQMQQQMMMQQQMIMQQQMEQQQMMIQQQMLIQKQLENELLKQPPPIINNEMKKLFVFNNAIKGRREVSARNKRTVEELLNKYMNEVYGTTNKKMTFVYKAVRINRKEQSKISEFFKGEDVPSITAIEN